MEGRGDGGGGGAVTCNWTFCAVVTQFELWKNNGKTQAMNNEANGLLVLVGGVFCVFFVVALFLCVVVCLVFFFLGGGGGCCCWYLFFSLCDVGLFRVIFLHPPKSKNVLFNIFNCSTPNV